MQTIDLLRMVAQAEFRPMNSNDHAYFCDAPVNTVIATVDDRYLILQTPAGYFEIYDNSENNGGQCWTVTVDHILN